MMLPDHERCLRCRIQAPAHRRIPDGFYTLCGACIQDLRGLDALDGEEPHTGQHLSSDVSKWIWETV